MQSQLCPPKGDSTYQTWRWSFPNCFPFLISFKGARGNPQYPCVNTSPALIWWHLAPITCLSRTPPANCTNSPTSPSHHHPTFSRSKVLGFRVFSLKSRLGILIPPEAARNWSFWLFLGARIKILKPTHPHPPNPHRNLILTHWEPLSRFGDFRYISEDGKYFHFKSVGFSKQVQP